MQCARRARARRLQVPVIVGSTKYFRLIARKGLRTLRKSILWEGEREQRHTRRNDMSSTTNNEWIKGKNLIGETMYTRDDGEWVIAKNPGTPGLSKTTWGLYGPVERDGWRHLTSSYKTMKAAKLEAKIMGECPSAWSKYGINRYHGNGICI